jgi:ElaB/YqjD/DUF883 family membrane-anchored ribosome-binding protein
MTPATSRTAAGYTLIGPRNSPAFTFSAAAVRLRAMKIHKLAPLTAALALLLGTAACKEKTTSEKVEEAVKETADDTKGALKNVGEELKDVGEAIKDGTKQAYEETKNAVKEGVDKVKETVDK